MAKVFSCNLHHTLKKNVEWIRRIPFHAVAFGIERKFPFSVKVTVEQGCHPSIPKALDDALDAP